MWMRVLLLGVTEEGEGTRTRVFASVLPSCEKMGSFENDTFDVSILATGKYGCGKVRVYPAECSQQLGRDPSNQTWELRIPCLKSFSGLTSLSISKIQNCLQWGRSNLVDPAGSPKIRLLLSSRDLLHIKFENLKKCNGDVNVTKINSKMKFPVTFTYFSYSLVTAGQISRDWGCSWPGALFLAFGALFLLIQTRILGKLGRSFLQGQEECPWPFLAVTLSSCRKFIQN